jgi:hypothetical protein
MLSKKKEINRKKVYIRGFLEIEARAYILHCRGIFL